MATICRCEGGNETGNRATADKTGAKGEATASSSSSSSTTTTILRPYISAAVRATNGFLSSLQERTEGLREPVVRGMEKVERRGSDLASSALIAYERRHEFGPYIVAGTATAVGGFVLIRRGKIPAVVTATAAAGLSYFAVYETIPLDDIPEILFGRK